MAIVEKRLGVERRRQRNQTRGKEYGGARDRNVNVDSYVMLALYTPNKAVSMSFKPAESKGCEPVQYRIIHLTVSF